LQDGLSVQLIVKNQMSKC